MGFTGKPERVASKAVKFQVVIKALNLQVVNAETFQRGTPCHQSSTAEKGNNRYVFMVEVKSCALRAFMRFI